MKRRANKNIKVGTAHHAARGFVALWATVMAQTKRANGTHAEIARQMLQAIEFDETRKFEGKPHVL